MASEYEEEGTAGMRPALLADRPATASKVERDVSPIEQVMNRLRVLLTELGGEIGETRQQLSPVLQSVEMVAHTSGVLADPEPPRSPLYRDLSEQCDRIADFIDEMRGVRSYLDVR